MDAPRLMALATMPDPELMAWLREHEPTYWEACMGDNPLRPYETLRWIKMLFVHQAYELEHGSGTQTRQR